ncbi:hypothetical protein [Streptomyces chartreusis]|uniref:hypothetical protein n=1 Tax=Streptomyces chartreusis TaxID=1969 RepID=UPI00123D5764|nr:hypothetical protein [Streptomyces chartreusis]QEV68330.1 hypothetical protein CP983_17690 [Streptomyces chartreusis]GGX35062.1 hypothetical protein GCM10010321_58030 [Streptomyces chartreusis]
MAQHDNCNISGDVTGTVIQGEVNGIVTGDHNPFQNSPVVITGNDVTVHEGGNTGGIRQNF